MDLSDIKKTLQTRPYRALVYGPHKIGKSTFCAQAPGAVFLPTEDGQDAIDAEAFPLLQSWDALMEAIGVLYTQEHSYRSVILDSLDWAEVLAQRSVCDDQGVPSIEKIGYGKGYVFACDKVRELLDGLNALRTDRGMNILLISHAEIRKFDDPLADSYDRYQIKLHKLVSKVTQEWSDVIGFANIESITEQTEAVGFDKQRTRALDTGRRVLHLAPSAAYDAGSRFDLPAKLPLQYDVFAEALEQSRKGK